MNDQSDGDKPVLTTAPSQSGANYYRPVDSQANEVAENSSEQANASIAEQPMATPEPISSTPEPVSPPPASISPTLETANPMADKPEDPAKHFVDLPSLSLPSAEEAPSSGAVYVPPASTMPPEPPISPEASIPTMPAMPPTPPMPPVPSMSAGPIMPPLPQKFSVKDSTINAPESPAEISEKMKTVNKKAGGQGIGKVIMAILLVAVMVVGGWLAYNWYQSSAKPRSIALNQDDSLANKDSVKDKDSFSELSVITIAAQHDIYNQQFPQKNEVMISSENYSGQLYSFYDSVEDTSYVWGRLENVISSEESILKSWLVNESGYYSDPATMDVIFEENKLVGYFAYVFNGNLDKRPLISFSYDSQVISDGPGIILIESNTQ